MKAFHVIVELTQNFSHQAQVQLENTVRVFPKNLKTTFPKEEENFSSNI